jgi:DNA-binding NtrC family response regulator
MLMRTTTLELPESAKHNGGGCYPLSHVGTSACLTTTESHSSFPPLSDEIDVRSPSLPPGALEHPDAFARIVTRNPEMRLLFQYLESIAPTHLPVLVTGETGVGKELIAEAIHNLSGCQGKLVTVNVAGVDDDLFSDTLFGHKRGGFTGADRDRSGLIEMAAGGTLFLDEIGDLALGSQVKLLRLLQEGKYYPIGSDTVKLTDARFIVATNQDLNLMQQKGLFRKDLYYRLRAHNVVIPPLRHRRDDIPLLVEHFLERAAAILGKKRPTPPRELLPLLENLPFAGNIRELEGIILDLVSRHKSGVLSIAPIRGRMSAPPVLEDLSQTDESPHSLVFSEQMPTMKEAERLVIEEALKRCSGIQTLAAQMLGMSRRALNNRVGKIRRRKKPSN